MRPACAAEFCGQGHLLAAGAPLASVLEHGRAHSMILWGPPGTGKTTLARMIASACDAEMIALSAVMSGVKDIRQAVETARLAREGSGRATILFIDEVHRFNKSQQDAFLPYVEDGTVTFIGATTENPSFEVNNALLSRARVYVLKSLTTDDLGRVFDRALADSERGLGAHGLQVQDGVREQLIEVADGDARRLLNLLEILADQAPDTGATLDAASVQAVLQGDSRRFDKGGDVFYDQISALHKSVRGSAPDAALYWLCRMLDGGCDPLYIARRLVRMASEDIGNADPRALQIALDAWQAQERLGSPEGELALAQAVVYLAVAAKSNAVYGAYKAAMKAAREQGSREVPPHLRNAPTRLMKELGHGKDYRYAHDETHGYAAGEQYFPDGMGSPEYYQPVDRGLEAQIRKKLADLRGLDRKARAKAP